LYVFIKIIEAFVILAVNHKRKIIYLVPFPLSIGSLSRP